MGLLSIDLFRCYYVDRLADSHCAYALRADQWDVQAAIQRVNDSLIERGYVTWFDLTNMKGKFVSVSACLCLSIPLSALHNICVLSLNGIQAVLWTR